VNTTYFIDSLKTVAVQMLLNIWYTSIHQRSLQRCHMLLSEPYRIVVQELFKFKQRTFSMERGNIQAIVSHIL